MPAALRRIVISRDNQSPSMSTADRISVFVPLPNSNQLTENTTYIFPKCENETGSG